MHPSEKLFAEFLERQGKTWKAQPCRFKLGDTTYTPDFYCLEEDVYYEVKNQCSSKEIEKIVRFKKAYPKISLKVVSPNGYPFYSRGSDAYIAVLKSILEILLSKDITEVSDNELAFLELRAPHVKGIHRPPFNHDRPLSRTVRKASIHA